MQLLTPNKLKGMRAQNDNSERPDSKFDKELVSRHVKGLKHTVSSSAHVAGQ